MFKSKFYFKSLTPAVTWFVDEMGVWEIPVAAQFSEMILVIWGYPWVDLHPTYPPPPTTWSGRHHYTANTTLAEKNVRDVISDFLNRFISVLVIIFVHGKRSKTVRRIFSSKGVPSPFPLLYYYLVTRSGHNHHFFEEWELLNLLWYLPWFLPKLDGQDLSSSPSETSLGENWEIRCWNILLNTQDTPG